MNFASLEYLGFLLGVWLAYVALHRRGQNVLLLVASYYFYACWNWKFLSLIILSTAVDYSVGKYLARNNAERARRLALLVSLVTNLGLLAVFKYYGFFTDSAVDLLQSVGVSVHRPTFEIVLPVGISFYTFQTLSYTIDVYRRRLQPCRSLLDFSLFVAFFPQLVAGPIERAAHLLPTLQNRRTISSAGLKRGLFLILLGLTKKVAIADGLAGCVDSIYGTSAGVSGLDVAVATYAFAFQILCDFSAYTDIARGTAKLFGIDLMNNFNAPYFARSPGDFWRRWHISLSSWLRDYLYISLGGNRKGPRREYANLMITMVLGGLWHGAAWNFVLWGIYQSALLCVFRLIASRRRDEESTSAPGIRGALPKVFATALFFQLTCFGWLLFRASSLAQIVDMSSALVDPAGWSTFSFPRPPLAALLGLLFFLPWEAMTFFTGRSDAYRGWHPFLQGCLVGVLLILLLMGTNNDASTFIYFQF